MGELAATTGSGDLGAVDQALAQVDTSARVPELIPVAIGADSEKDRMRRLIRGEMNVPDPADAGRAPTDTRVRDLVAAANAAPPEPKGDTFDPYEAARQQAAAVAAEPAKAPAATAASATDADAEYERSILRLAEPEAKPPAGGEDVDGLKARLKQANDTLIEAARDFKRDSIGSLNELGVTPAHLIEQLRARGHLPAAVAAAETAHAAAINTLPEDADPTLKALLRENEALRQEIPKLRGEFSGVLSHLTQRDQAAREEARRAQRQFITNKAATHAREVAQRMPTLRSSGGTLNTEGKLVLQLVTERLDHELPEGISPADAAKRAERMIAEASAQAGIKPKAERAAAALDPARRPPVPIVTGATAPRTMPGGQPGGRKINFDDDEQRQAGMADWFLQNTPAATA